MEEASKSDRLVRNTLFLYVRMGISMVIGLYTSRVTIEALGLENYGIYGLVGGLTVVMSIITSVISASYSRFITFELGRNNLERLKKIFSAAITIQLAMALIGVILAETFGNWILNTVLDIPQDRMFAANCVWQCTIFSFITGLIIGPYGACIVAHEKFDIYAYYGLLEIVLKLGVVYMLYISPYDKLITYAVLLLLLSCFMQFVYTRYCVKHFEECKYKFSLSLDKKLLKELFSFAGWSFVGSTSAIFANNVIGLLMNTFFGVAVNAALLIANQVNSALQGFVANFMASLSPQITKSYAAKETDYFYSLICRGAKFSYYIYMCLLIPVVIETKEILTLWLGVVPEYSVAFVRMIIGVTIINILAEPVIRGVLATGEIKKYQIYMVCVSWTVFPVTWLLFHFNFGPIYYYYVYFVVFGVVLSFLRLYLFRQLTDMPIMMYVRQVYLPIIITTAIAVIPPVITYRFISDSLISVICVTAVSLISSLTAILTIGVTSGERKFIISKCLSVFKIRCFQ